METMGSRLRRAMKDRGRTVKDIVAARVMSRANAYLILNDTTTPEGIRAETVDKLCRYLRLNREWLISGKGPMDSDEVLRASQPATLDPDILFEALVLIDIDQAEAGKYYGRAYAVRLAELYGRIAADGGQLSSAKTLEFEREVESRKQGRLHATKAAGRRAAGSE